MNSVSNLNSVNILTGIMNHMTMVINHELAWQKLICISSFVSRC